WPSPTWWTTRYNSRWTTSAPAWPVTGRLGGPVRRACCETKNWTAQSTDCARDTATDRSGGACNESLNSSGTFQILTAPSALVQNSSAPELHESFLSPPFPTLLPPDL